MKLFLISLLIINLASAQDSLKVSHSIDLMPFFDSAHHWYDIHDENRVIEPLPDQKRYEPDEIEKIADNILLFQKHNGGWPKNYDMQAVLTDEQKEALLNARDETNTTFDNGSTHSQVIYLAKAYSLTQDKRYRDACLKGINFILSAQYDNGGFPQTYPEKSGYSRYITFNDGVMAGIMEVLFKIRYNSREFSFVDDELRVKAKEAFDKGIECILKCQIKENDKLLVWGQQHDEKTLLPVSARTFEPAAICNGESTGIVKLLMKIENPDKRIIKSVKSAVEWFNKSKIYGLKYMEIKSVEEEYRYHKADFDRIVVEDSTAPPIWARYYELKTHVPLFSNRNGIPVYNLNEVERERRTGYAWYGFWPQEVLDLYPEWEKKWLLN